MISQRPNDIRKANGVLSRLAKERAILDVLAKKYKMSKSQECNLEDYARLVIMTVVSSDAPFMDYKTANKGARQ